MNFLEESFMCQISLNNVLFADHALIRDGSYVQPSSELLQPSQVYPVVILEDIWNLKQVSWPGQSSQIIDDDGWQFTESSPTQIQLLHPGQVVLRERSAFFATNEPSKANNPLKSYGIQILVCLLNSKICRYTRFAWTKVSAILWFLEDWTAFFNLNTEQPKCWIYPSA